MIYDLLWLISAYYDLRIMTISLSKLLELLILCKFVNKKYDYNDYSIFIILKAGYPKNEMLC